MNDTERIDALEKMCDEGLCPALLNDDNGHWAMVFDGTQNIATTDEPADIHSSHFVPAALWKPTVREAIDAGVGEFRVDGEQSGVGIPK